MNTLNGNESQVHKGNRSLDGSHINRNGLPVGTLVPAFRLPQLDGNELSLGDYRGRQVLLIFSDPSCGPCNLLAPELERLHRNLPGLQFLMVSRGDPGANGVKVAEHGLTFPVVLQRRWEISREYAMFATPIAYLIDEQGVIATEVAVGSNAILTLAVEHETVIRSYKEGKIMRDRLQTRLQELKKEFETGQSHLQELEKQQMYLRETMLRISGAIQVLEELLDQGRLVEHHEVNFSETQPPRDQVHSVNLMDTALQTPHQEEYNHRPSQDGVAVDVKIGKE